MTDVISTDPRTGEAVEVVAREASREDVDRACRLAAQAAPALEAMGRAGRRAMLLRCADALDEARSAIVAVADRETALGAQRFQGELSRTTFQLRLFADVLDEGSYLEASIDHARETPMGPRPDLRRMLVPTGPVAVFGASNFPLAFSVPGGDTASALAAGCPVVVKAHGSHPATSQLCGDVLARALADVGAPEGTLQLVHGVRAGVELVQHPAITAVAFTGSLNGGKALMALINERPDPVPFYGELSSLNPVVVTPAAAAERGAAIGEGVIASAMTGAGQFCTKPGLVLVPAGQDGDAVVDAMAAAVQGREPEVLLNAGIAAAFARRTDELRRASGLEVLAQGVAPQEVSGAGTVAQPLLLAGEAATAPVDVTEECFGPVTVVVRYTSVTELGEFIDRLPSSLTATIHRGATEMDLPRAIAAGMRKRAGRLLFDGYPTGVAVAWAQHHGGPWPSTSSQHTSVGATAIRRFLRPFTWQDAPQDLLPAELVDDTRLVPRREDGALRLVAEGASPSGARPSPW
jgi:NADP-dependent aldehyde dehydrogenase